MKLTFAKFKQLIREACHNAADSLEPEESAHAHYEDQADNMLVDDIYQALMTGLGDLDDPQAKAHIIQMFQSALGQPEDVAMDEADHVRGSGGTGGGTHHAMSGMRFGRGRGREREWRSKSGLDPHIMDEADGSDPRMGADMYTHGYKFSHEPERQRRGHTGGTRDVDDPGHPIFIYEDDEDY